jgi:alcohol/geraniol dehydrogenase (NADP+)
MTEILAWAASAAKQKLALQRFELGELPAEEVEIAVEYCGLCHSDLSMLNNDWNISQYPAVLGHEAVGRVIAVGERVQSLQVNQRVGVGWNAGCCLHCYQCKTGHHNLCAKAQPTVAGHYGGFANKLRAHELWAIPLPDALDISTAGPLLCGGITVFSPLYSYNIKPTAHVGVVGIGGLGHLALKFAKAWGCEVTAFTSHESKTAEAKSFGAHNVVSSRDSAVLASMVNTLDLLIVTVNVPLDWTTLLRTLKPNGRLHIVGVVLEAMPIPAFELIMGQKSVSGSPTGDPAMLATMLEFAARHSIAPQVEHFAMSQVNEALAHLEAGKARYRVVLDADFS